MSTIEDHDPLCELVTQPAKGLVRGWVCDCSRFEEVREDEREKVINVNWGSTKRLLAKSREDAIRECITALKGKGTLTRKVFDQRDDGAGDWFTETIDPATILEALLDENPK